MAERPEDLNLPNSVVTRLIKESLPDGVLISKEARSAIARAASVFVLYVTSTANTYAQSNKKKTLTGQDVLEAMKEMEFDQFIEPLSESLDNFKKTLQNKKDAKAKAKKAEGEKTPTKEKETAKSSEVTASSEPMEES